MERAQNTEIFIHLGPSDKDEENKMFNTSGLVRYTHFLFLLFTFYFLLFFSLDFCHHGSGGAALDSPPSQQDPYF
jgi:hypothetical protein